MINVFKFAGVSRTDGVLKTRFASDKVAVKMIEKKDPNADMVELPTPMGKIDAINYLFSIQFHMANADQVDAEVNDVLTDKLEYLKNKDRLARGEYKPKGRKTTEGKVKPLVVFKEPDPNLAPYGWKKDGTPKAAPGRKAQAVASTDDTGLSLQNIMQKKIETATKVENSALEDAPF